MSDGDASFAAALHQQLHGKAGNLFYSPASVRIAMAMAAAGARGETAAQLHKGLALPAGDAANTAFASSSPTGRRWRRRRCRRARPAIRRCRST